MSGFLLSFLVAISLHLGAQAVEYTVANNVGSTLGGKRFDREIGLQYCRTVLDSATKSFWNVFQQSGADRRNTMSIGLVVDGYKGVAYSSGDLIHLSGSYVQSYSGNVKTEVTGIIYHEVAHSLQWNGAGKAPTGLIEGIADYFRFRAGYTPRNWANPGDGTSWNEGYGVTAQFLLNCDRLRNGFVAQLNNKMRSDYNDSYFADLLGKPIDQLWKEYKAKYGKQ